MGLRACYGKPMPHSHPAQSHPETRLSPSARPPSARIWPCRFAGLARFALVLGSGLVLSACSEGKYPSLAQRPVERRAPSAAPVAAPLIAEPVPAALRANLAALLAQAHAAHDAFLAHRGEADRLVAAASSSPAPGDAPPSVAWSAANEALAELDANRADIARAQDKLERLYIDDRVAHAIADGNSGSATARPTGAAIAAARDTVLALVQQEDDILTALKSRLP